MDTVFHNGIFVSGAAVLPSGNRAFHFGDGLFETLKIRNGSILLKAFHFDRLFNGLRLLQIDSRELSADFLEKNILQLCERNHCLSAARIRLTIYRAEHTGVLIESFLLSSGDNGFNEEGWKIDIYPHARKAMDALANLKSCSALPYTMAALFAKERGEDDSLLLNTGSALCESSIANVFLVKKGECFTPALHQGCVDGVMRRYLIEEIKMQGIPVHQTVLYEQDLLEADEVFLTNAIRGIRWVRFFRSREYGCHFSRNLYQNCVSTL